MDTDDLLANRRGGQVDKKTLVEPPLAEKLRRQPLDVVGRGDNKHITRALLHPRKEVAEDTLRNAAVLVAAAGERLFDLVDP